jgi:hypothetical protein
MVFSHGLSIRGKRNAVPHPACTARASMGSIARSHAIRRPAEAIFSARAYGSFMYTA